MKPAHDLSVNTDRARRMTRMLLILTKYVHNVPVEEIADDFECHKSTVLRYARVARLPRRPRHFPEVTRKRVLAALRKHLPYATIRERYEVSDAYISALAAKHKLRRYTTGKGKRNKQAHRVYSKRRSAQ